MVKTKTENALAVKPKRKDINRVAYLMVLPFVVVFLIFSVYPVARTFYLSFTDYKGYGDAGFVALANYKRVVTDKFFWRALLHTLHIWIPNIVVQLGLAFLLTIIFSDIKYKVRGLSIYRALFYLPNLIACTSVAFLFKFLLDWKYGTINKLLIQLGVISSEINFFGDKQIAPVAVGLIGAWMWFGNSFIMLMAGVQGIPKDYFEAAAIDGAGRWRTFGKITLPLLRPILLYVAITSLIGGLQMFDLPFLISGGTAGNPGGSLQTVIMYLYKFGFETYQVGYASAVAYVLFMIILVASVIQLKVMNKKED